MSDCGVHCLNLHFPAFFFLATVCLCIKFNLYIIMSPPPHCPSQLQTALHLAQNKRATHICVDCGYIYALPTAFAEQPRDYKCALPVSCLQ